MGGCISDLEERMKRADYEHEYSDSHLVWKDGMSEKVALIRDLKAIPHNIANDLIKKYVPAEYQSVFFLAITGKGL